MQGKPSGIALLSLSMLLWSAAGCPGPKQQALPEKIPTPPVIEFTKLQEGWPPRPQGRTNVINVPWTAIAGALNATQEAEIHQAAVLDTRVQAALGARFGYITAAEVEPAKDHPRSANELLSVRLTFYSYTNNVAIQVLTRGKAVEQVERREGYQPPEGAEEIKAAIELAQRSPTLRGVVKNMRATAIVTHLQQREQPGYGHRVLHVSFSVEGEDAPRYYALADLTDHQIVAAGKPVAEEGGGIR
jgi:hypothetical protein